MARRVRRTKARRSEDVWIDQHVGKRLRERRAVLGLSQTAIADRLGITFQQVQKYERGANRVSASRLYACAQFLEVPPEFFFEGLEGSDSGTPDATRSDEGKELARAYYSIDDPAQRLQVRKLVQAIAASDS